MAVPTLQMVDDVLGVQKCSPQSLHLNRTVNSFMDLEKLKLSKKKCHKIHIGPQDRNCPDLKVHGKMMHKSSAEKYLGNIFNKSGKNKENIETRVAKGYQRVNTIFSEDETAIRIADAYLTKCDKDGLVWFTCVY